MTDNEKNYIPVPWKLSNGAKQIVENQIRAFHISSTNDNWKVLNLG